MISHSSRPLEALRLPDRLAERSLSGSCCNRFEEINDDGSEVLKTDSLFDFGRLCEGEFLGKEKGTQF